MSLTIEDIIYSDDEVDLKKETKEDKEMLDNQPKLVRNNNTITENNKDSSEHSYYKETLDKISDIQQKLKLFEEYMNSNVNEYKKDREYKENKRKELLKKKKNIFMRFK